MDSVILEYIRAYGLQGVSGALLILLILRCARWFAPRLETWGNRLVNSHEKLVDSAVRVGETNADTLRTQSETLEGQSRALNNLAQAQSSQIVIVAKIESHLEQLRKRQDSMHSENRSRRQDIVS